MDREIIREKTMQLIFQMDATGDFNYEDLNIIEEDNDVIDKKKAIAVLEAVRDHIDEIDDVISKNLDRWTMDRVSKTDLAILRTCLAEMMYIDSIPVRVSINEAVNLSKKYGDDKSFKFVNSVLSKADKYLKDREK